MKYIKGFDKIIESKSNEETELNEAVNASGYLKAEHLQTICLSWNRSNPSS